VLVALSSKNNIEERFEIVEMLLKAGVALSGTYEHWDDQTVMDLVLDSGDERYLRLFGLQNVREKLLSTGE